jgi:hypothetical protein
MGGDQGWRQVCVDSAQPKQKQIRLQNMRGRSLGQTGHTYHLRRL